MSRSQQNETYDTAKSESATNYSNAQASDQKTQSDIDSNKSQLAKYTADNPYVQGGEYQTSTNQQLSNTADSTASSAKAQNQQQAQRTGQNPAAANAAGEAEQQSAQRTLSDDEASATKDRLSSKSSYDQTGITDAQAITDDEQALASQESSASTSELSSQESAAQTPSFLDSLGNGLTSLASTGASIYKTAKG